MYDMMLVDEGRRTFMIALGNLPAGNLDQMGEILNQDEVILGLGDGGAHYGMISDSSYSTFMLAHWARDRKGRKFSLPHAVRMLTRNTATAIGLHDRGLIAPGYKADINVIDHDKLALHAPTLVNDLPGGGPRLDQSATGYVATVVSGELISRDGVATKARPGRLVRGRRQRPAA
jgi:N-acyl-D-aspartate/D-glutamate deacylase